ncbi:MAG: M3 family metallopeptidase [Steroidobacteraceae bacterium]
MDNPLLAPEGLPDFAAAEAGHVEPAVRTIIDRHRSLLAGLPMDTPSFAGVIEPFETANHALARVWNAVQHLGSVLDSPELREAYNTCRALVADYHAEVGQNTGLYRACETILQRESAGLDPEQRKLLDNLLRDFRLAGVALPEAGRARFRALMQELAVIQARFDENVLDATQAWSLHLTSQARLAGLPRSAVLRAADTASARGLDGWVFTLDEPNYVAVMNHAVDRELRREFYLGWTTRASDRGPQAGRFDNSTLMEQILSLRHEAAQLLGFESYADLSLATKMAASPADVLAFLEDLARRYRPAACAEFEALRDFAGGELEAWDVAFHAERMRQERHALSQEALREYFPLPKVLQGLFEVARRLYGVSIERRAGVSTWHPDVDYYAILDGRGRELAGFFLDPCARQGKRGGAWMDDCINRRAFGGQRIIPVAQLVCNFAPASGDAPPLLTHGDVVTLFHEFGHGLHLMMTQVNYPSIAGISGVPWDAVELPSQFMEQYAWQPDVLPLISAHLESGEPLPAAMLERLLGLRGFHAGLATVRQLEFALFDFRLHAGFDPRRGGRIMEVLDAVRGEVAVVRPPADNRFPHAFQHIFSGGYAAGYYSYKWAEVLAADAFAAFEDTGIFDATVAMRFLDSILSRGGSRDVMEAFVEFRGRRPDVQPLLRQHGLAA